MPPSHAAIADVNLLPLRGRRPLVLCGHPLAARCLGVLCDDEASRGHFKGDLHVVKFLLDLSACGDRVVCVPSVRETKSSLILGDL